MTTDKDKPDAKDAPDGKAAADKDAQDVGGEAQDGPHHEDAMGNPIKIEQTAPAAGAAPLAAVPKVRRGERVLVYRGLTDLVELGGYQFRPGIPVAVTEEIAEELLTHPRENFEEAQGPSDGSRH